jgi:hypothetical protein
VIVNRALVRPGRYTCTFPPLFELELELELEPVAFETYSHPFGATASDSGSAMPSVIVSAGDVVPEVKIVTLPPVAELELELEPPAALATYSVPLPSSARARGLLIPAVMVAVGVLLPAAKTTTEPVEPALALLPPLLELETPALATITSPALSTTIATGMLMPLLSVPINRLLESYTVTDPLDAEEELELEPPDAALRT